MSATNEMIKQNVMDWIDAVVVGVKVFNTEIVCADVPEQNQWKVTARTYQDCMEDGFPTIHVHTIDAIAKAAEFDLQHRDFTPADEYYRSFTGEDFFIFNGVKFSDMIIGHFSDEEKEVREKEIENAREQSSDSGTSEEESVVDE